MTALTSSSQNAIHFAALSDVGRKRPTNQDAHAESLVDENDARSVGHFFVVADGMGAHAAGELASQLAVQEVEAHYRLKADTTVQEALVQALKKANTVIHERGQRDTQLYNMGTTCSTLVIVSEGAIAAHVGDSRIYRCRHNIIEQLTFDHSLVWELRAVGKLGPSDCDMMIPRNVITRCLGPHAEVDADIEGPFSIQKGDVFLLCSDGLTGRVSDSEMGAIAGNLPPEVAVQFLVDLANLYGGSDNITVVIAQITDEALSAPGRVRETTPPAGPTGAHAAWAFGAGLGLLTVMISLALEDNTVAALGFGLFLLFAIGAAWQGFRQTEGYDAKNVSPYVRSVAKVDKAFIDSIIDTFTMVLESLPPDDIAKMEAEVRKARELSEGDEETRCLTLANIARRLVVALPEEVD